MVSISMTSSNTVIRGALRTLEAEVKTTQNRIATGLKVSSYADNAAVWTAASTLRSDISLADNVKSNLTNAKGQADVASAALTNILNSLSKMQQKAVEAQGSGASKATIAGEMAGLVQQIKASLAGAKFQGKNWLDDADATQTIAIGIDNGADISLTFATEKMNGATAATPPVDRALKTVLATAMSASTNFATLATDIDSAIEQATGYAGKISGFATALDQQIDFLTTLNDIRNKAVSSLVDADLEEESARAKALEVRQQLAYQALSIGNDAQQNILLLFR